MARQPRWWIQDAVYSEVKRTVDRQFLLRPCPEVRNIIGACLGRAQKRFPVRLHWVEANINHLQIGKSAVPGKLENLSAFDQLLYSLLSRELNRLWKRDGPVWSTRNRSTICLDDASAEQQLLYSMTNPVKDGLCTTVERWSALSFSSYSQAVEHKRERYSFVNWTRWHKAGGTRKDRKSSDYTEYVEVEFSPLPGMAGWTDEERAGHLRREICQIERKEKARREREGRSAMVPKRLLEIDPRGRPSSEPTNTPKPLCHGASAAQRKLYRDDWNKFLREYRAASGFYRMGLHDTEFPGGSFRPPNLGLCGSPMDC